MHASLVDAASAYKRPSLNPVVVLAAFGTTQPGALRAILNVAARVQKAFPAYETRLAFTSNVVRNIWRRRARDEAFRREHPDVPEAIYGTTNVLSVLAAIQEEGPRPVLVQSLHITDGEEYADLANLTKTLAEYRTLRRALRPFPWIGVGEPALGVGDGRDGPLERAAEALRPLVERACETGAALVLMGHGNEHLRQGVFARFEETLRRRYFPHIHVGTVEARPFAGDIADRIGTAANPPPRILLAPLMLVAGDHALNDMAGDEDDSWASIFRHRGFEVEPWLVGLGMNDSWADIYVEHLKAVEEVVLTEKAREENGA